MHIYVASSWRTAAQPKVVKALWDAGHAVFDARLPCPEYPGFSWSDADPRWYDWTAAEFREALNHPLAEMGFARAMDALEACDACVLVLPSGRSAHLELGFVAGMGKPTFALLEDGCEPELMYRMCTRLCLTITELIAALRGISR
jgi:hypothetical protein